jgi:hypothetical protein
MDVRQQYVVTSFDMVTQDIETFYQPETGQPFPSKGMADAFAAQKAAMSGPRKSWLVETV